MRKAVKLILGKLLGKSGPVSVALFVADAADPSRRMVDKIRLDVPGYPLMVIARPGVDRDSFPADVEWIEAAGALPYLTVRRALARRWVGLAPVMLDGADRWQRLFWAFLTAPHRVLAFHADGESHPLRLGWPIASWRFLRGERLGDLFRPTPFRWLRELLRWIPALALFGGWVQARRRATRPAAETSQPMEEAWAVIYRQTNNSMTTLDREIRSSRAAVVILAIGTRRLADETIAAIRDYLRRPGVWMATGRARCRYEVADGAAGTLERESGTYCLGAPANLLAFRRDVYLRLGGLAANEESLAGRGLAVICLLALLRGWKTVYAGEIIDPAAETGRAAGATGCESRVAELVVAGLDAARPALKSLHRHAGNPEFRRQYWRDLRSIRPTATGGKRTGKLLPLAEPGAVAYIGREAGGRPKVGVLTPYFPFPLSHGGAIRIFNLLRHAAADFDIHLFAFAESENPEDIDAVLEHCARVVLVKPPVWETPRWIRVLPRGVRRYRVEQMRRYIEEFTKDFGLSLLQIEFTQLAFFGKWVGAAIPKVLVEHDVTFDLHRQAIASAAGWNRVQARTEAWRWRKFELSAMPSFERVITMSSADRKLLAAHGIAESKLAVVENGIDLERFQAFGTDASEDRLLFIGSFRHFPNIRAYRFLAEKIWPRIIAERAGAKLTVVAGPEPELYWRKHLGGEMPDPPAGVDLRAFVADVRPLYEASRVVAVPVPLSAGTNIKVLEALAMGRPVVSTRVGCAGLDLENEHNVLIADGPADFASAVLRLFSDQELRLRLSREGRRRAEQRFGWPALATKQRQIWDELLRSHPRRPSLPE